MNETISAKTTIAQYTIVSLGWLLLTVLVVRAEHLPVKTYTTADGLPRDSVTRIKQDSRGFIWMIAGDGISRFDGYSFTTTTEDGLPIGAS